MIIPVAVEKVGLSEKSRKTGDRKCLGNSGKSFIELPDAIRFLRFPSERVFQQPPLFSTPIRGLQKVEALREWFQANLNPVQASVPGKPRCYQTPRERAQFLHRWSSQRFCDSQAQNCFSLSAKLPAQGI